MTVAVVPTFDPSGPMLWRRICSYFGRCFRRFWTEFLQCWVKHVKDFFPHPSFPSSLCFLSHPFSLPPYLCPSNSSFLPPSPPLPLSLPLCPPPFPPPPPPPFLTPFLSLIPSLHPSLYLSPSTSTPQFTITSFGHDIITETPTTGTPSGNDKDSSGSETWHASITALFQDWNRTLSGMECRRPDHSNHRMLLWKCLSGINLNMTEPRSRILVPMLLRFIRYCRGY